MGLWDSVGLVTQGIGYLRGRGQQQDAANHQAKLQEEARIAYERDIAIARDRKQTQYQDQLGLRQGQLDTFLGGLDESRGAFGNQLAMANQLGSMGLQDATKQLMTQGAQRAASQQIAGSESARGALGGAARAQQGLTDAYSQMGAMDAQQRMQNKSQQIAAQGNYGNQMNALNTQQLNAQNQFNNWNMQADTAANIDPYTQSAYQAYGEGQRARDYQEALQGSMQQNEAQMFNQLSQYAFQQQGKQDKIVMQVLGMGTGMPSGGGGGNGAPPTGGSRGQYGGYGGGYNPQNDPMIYGENPY